MVEFISHNPHIDFSGKFKFAGLLSLCFVLIAFGSVLFKGINYGVDFRGGAEVQVRFNHAIDLDKMRDILEHDGYKGAQVQSIGDVSENEYLIKVQSAGENLNSVAQKISDSLKKEMSGDGVEIRKTDIVGPKAGGELRAAGFKAMFYSILAIMIYVGLRFDFRYAPGAALSLIHDAIFVTGIWSLLGLEFSLQTVAAILTVLGYSINDTVVIFDRVRECEEANPSMSLVEVLDRAINETLSRTVLTVSVTLFTSVAMFMWGGASIKDFFFAISLGFVIGTYSTIFVAAPVTLLADKIKRQNALKKKQALEA